MTLTFEIPEDLIPIFAAIPESERSSFAIAAIRTVLSEQESAAELPKDVEEDNDFPQETG